MTQKEIINHLAKSKADVLQPLLDLLTDNKITCCTIDGFAVNAYVEPAVNLDLDLVIAADAIEPLCQMAAKHFEIKKFEHGVNLKCPHSDLRIQLQTDQRYQSFIQNARLKKLMGYKMYVADVADVLQGKIWAYCDNQRRQSKRQKDLEISFEL